MKDYNEMAESVLSRRDKYVIERRKRMRKVATAISCFCLCALLGIGAWQSGVLDRNTVTDARSDESKYGSGAVIPGSANITEDSGNKQEKTAPSVENLASENPSDMGDSLGWIIWQGQEYVQDDSPEGPATLDQYLGIVTEFDGYYQNNEVGGSLYTVKDSDTLLFAKLDNGAYVYLHCSKENGYDAPVQNEAGNTGALEAPDSRAWETIWGGSYMDESGSWVVWLTEDTPENRAEVFQRNPSLHENSTIFKTAEYSLEYLTGLMAGISRAMENGSLPAVSSAALQEDINRVVVCMSRNDADAAAKVLAFDDLGGAIEVISGNIASTEEQLTQK